MPSSSASPSNNAHAARSSANSHISLPLRSQTTLAPGIQIKINGINIVVLPNEEAVNHFVADRIIASFKKGGLVALAADSTHGSDLNANRFGGIYSKVDIHLMSQEGLGSRISKDLYLTNLDELDPRSKINPRYRFANGRATEPFAKSIESDLGFVIAQVGKRWQPLDPKNIAAYSALFARHAGNSTAYVGLGAGAKGAHIAYYGERGVQFPSTSRLKLDEQEAQRRNVSHAYSMGAAELQQINEVVVTVKGQRKADSLFAGFADGLRKGGKKTGLGWLVANRPENLTIIADREAARRLFRLKEFRTYPRSEAVIIRP